MTDEKIKANPKDGADEREFMALIGARLTDDVPTRLVVVPWGEVESTAGSFVVDEESGAAVAEAFAAHGADLPIDYEHQTLGGVYASPHGRAPAAGWITAVEAVPGEGIVARVNWTAEARQMLAAKEYRYLSPVAIVRKRDRKLIALHSAALTNKPAIVGMAAIINRAEGDADKQAAVLAALSAKLNLPADENADAVLVAAHRRIADLESAAAQRDAEGRIAAAQAAGKLTPAQREWAMTLAMARADLFDEWERTAPVVVPFGRTAPPGAESRLNDRGLTGAARAEYRACKALHGLTSEDAYVADALRHRLS